MNSLKSLAMNCGPLSEMTRGLTPGVPLFGPFQNDLDVGLGHGFAQIPMNQETAVASRVETRTTVRPRAKAFMRLSDLRGVLRCGRRSAPVSNNMPYGYIF
jgi:hypothetical protein